MARQRFSLHWLAVGMLSVGGWTGTAIADEPLTCTSCGSAECSSCGGGVMCGKKGLKQYPTFDSHYIKKFCAPTICPGSCFGHFQTKWTPWAYACPQWTPGGMPHDPSLVNWYPPTYGLGNQTPAPPTIPPAASPAAPSEPVPAPRPAPDEQASSPLPMPTLPTLPDVPNGL